MASERRNALAVGGGVIGGANIRDRPSGARSRVTMERVGFDRRPAAKALEDTLERATATLPGALAQAAFEATWTGTRPGPPDERPHAALVLSEG